MGRVLLGVLPCCLTPFLSWVAGLLPPLPLCFLSVVVCCRCLFDCSGRIGQSAFAMARWCYAAAGSNVTDIHIAAIGLKIAACAKAQPALYLDKVRMSILGEVRVTHLKCMQRFTQDMGATEVIDVQCRIAGNAGGKATIRASLHIRTATFDDEKWKIITLMCSHYANYYTLFAPSCGSVGDFTDIQQDADGNLAITSEMQCYNFSVRRLNGDFYAHVYPFDSKFYRKVHPAGALLFSGVHSHLMLLQYILIHLPNAKAPIWVISDVPKYWLEYDGTMCLDEEHRWKSTATIEYLRTHGLHCVPNSIKAIIGDLVYNGTRSRASNDPPPGL